MNRRVTSILAGLGLVGIIAAGAALAQNDTPPPDTSAQPSGPGTDTDATPAPPDQAPAEQAAPTTPDETPPAPTPKVAPTARPTTAAGAAPTTTVAPPAEAEAPPVSSGPPPVPANAVLLMTGLDKITGKPTQIAAPLNVPVRFATFTITARYCYSTPPSETPETSAFVQIDDHRPDQPEHRVFSGWMYASSPGLNGVEHPLYDVWVISCKTNAPGQAAAAHVASHAPVRVGSPDAADSEGVAPLPEGSGQ